MPGERSYDPLMSPPPPLMTADELLRTHVPHKRTELVRGVLVVREPAGSRHGLVRGRDPERRVARVDRDDGSETVVTPEGALEGEDVLPGFSCSLVSIL